MRCTKAEVVAYVQHHIHVRTISISMLDLLKKACNHLHQTMNSNWGIVLSLLQHSSLSSSSNDEFIKVTIEDRNHYHHCQNQFNNFSSSFRYSYSSSSKRVVAWFQVYFWVWEHSGLIVQRVCCCMGL